MIGAPIKFPEKIKRACGYFLRSFYVAMSDALKR